MTITRVAAALMIGAASVLSSCSGGGAGDPPPPSPTYTIGGMVSGLVGAGLVLQNNGGNNLAIPADGAFTFSIALISGAAYSVTVLTQPPARNCMVADGSGSVTSSNVTNVSVTCVLAPPTAPTVSLGFGVKELQFSWLAVTGADFYRLSENPDGVSGYTQVGADLTSLSYNHTIPVHRRLNASYIVEACNTAGCTASAPQVLTTNLTQAIGYFKASNTGADDNFGFAVALSGDGNTLAVGAFLEDSSTTGVGSTPNELAANAGAVYIFTRSAGGWSQQGYVKASNTGAGDLFGRSVALNGDGNTLAVGAPGESSNTTGINSTPNELAANAGAAYIFTRTAGTWSQQAYVKASNTEAGDSFGIAVALNGDGNTFAVGAFLEDSSAGAVYVLTRSAATWTQQAYVKAFNGGGAFGTSVALAGDGNTLAVGAPNENSSSTGINSTPNELAPAAGAVYVYTRSATTWSQQAYVKASNAGTNPAGQGDRFGISVALSGDGNTLAVGAWAEASSTTGINSTPNELATQAGAAYVFTRSAGNWSEQAYVKASNTGAGDNFGIAVALNGDGDMLAVGAKNEASSTTGIGSTPNESISGAGAVYVFARSAGTWSERAYVKASNTARDEFGESITLSSDGNTLAVGARFEDSSTSGIGSTPNESAPSAGAVYLY